MKKLLVAAALVASITAHAEISTTGLTEIQVAELQKQAAEMKDRGNSVTAHIDEYAELADKLSNTMTKTATNMGVVVNDFANSPVGMMTAGVVVWKYVGASLLSFIVGSLIAIIISIGTFSFINKTREIRIEYNTEKTNIFGNHPKKVVKKDSISDDSYIVLFGWAIAMFVCVAIAS